MPLGVEVYFPETDSRPLWWWVRDHFAASSSIAITALCAVKSMKRASADVHQLGQSIY